MQDNIKPWFRDKYVYYTFTICFGIALISFGYYIWQGEGVLTLRQDFNLESIPFSMAMNDAIKNGDIGWLWNIDLGTNFIGAFSYYNLGSPFLWISLLFPAEIFPYLVGWLYILKYAVAGMLAYLYIQRFTEKKSYAVLGGVLYAFSGFQTVNIIFHFHDMVALFPLLLIGLEKLAVEQKKGCFALAVFFNCLLNYYFFAGEVIFLIIYFVCRFGIKKESISTIFFCGVEAVMGIGMACVLFLPSILFIQGNPDSVAQVRDWLYPMIDYMEIIGGLLLPAEPMHLQSSIMLENYRSNSAYLPGIGLAFVIAYVIKGSGWIRRIIAVSFIICLCPKLNSVFYAFAQDYRRWYYMPVLIMILASVKVMENRQEYAARISSWIFLAIIGIYTGVLLWQVKIGKIEMYSMNSFLNIIIFAFACSVVLIVIQKNSAVFKVGIWGLVVMAAAATTANMVYLVKMNTDSAQTLKIKWEGDRELEDIDINFRYIADNSGACIGGVHPLFSFNTTITSSIYEMYDALNLTVAGAWVNYDVAGTIEWMSGKYYLLPEAEDMENIVDTIHYGEKSMYVVEKEACPIGFTYDYYALESELKQLDKQLRGVAVLNCLVIPDEWEEEVSKYLTKMNIFSFREEDTLELKDDIRNNIDHMVEIYEMNSEGFRAKAVADEATYAFFSVPYESGWTAYVDEKERQIMKTSGMMAVFVDEGESDIQFRYEIPGLKSGVVLSMVSTIVWGIYTYSFYKKRTKVMWQRDVIK